MRLLTLSIALIAVVLTAIEPAQAQNDQPYDVVVYGGTSAGIVAAVQTRRMGKTVVIVEPREHLGGLTTSGLGWTDTGNKAVIGGISREFYQRIKKKYDDPQRWVHEQRENYSRYRPDEDAMWTFEPHVAEEVFQEMLDEADVPVVRARLDEVRKDGTRIIAILVDNGRVLKGRQFIDATYEGDLLAKAGVTFTVGREPNAMYGETLNGVQKARAVSHQFIRNVDPYVKPGDKSSGLLPGVNDQPGNDGEGDHRVQAYNYRLCITDVKANQVPFEKPDDYDPLHYELLLRNFEAGDMRLPLKIDMMPNRKTDLNNKHAVSTDWIGMNYEYPEASPEERARFEQRLASYTRGLMWTLAYHPRTPEKIRAEVSRWGWAKDEWVDNNLTPYWPYVREARRMVSDHVHTELDCRRLRDCPDPVGMGSYNMDSHNCQRYVTDEGFVRNEGDIQISPGGPYQIAYRAITPKKAECTNLLVPVCLSSSHIAYGSIRMEPVFMILGQSAATAAVLSNEAGIAVQDLDYAVLRKKLDEDRQALEIPPGSVREQGISPEKLPGLVMDDIHADKTGNWLSSSSIGGFVGTSYLHDNDEAKGEKSIRFRFDIKEAGKYSVRMSYTPNPNRSDKVPVEVTWNDGSQQADRITVNQRRKPSIDGRFVELTSISAAAGSTVEVVISNKDTTGHVIADCVQLLPVR